MKNKLILLVTITAIFLACTTKEYHQVIAENPVYIPNTAFHSYEDLSSPKFQHLINKYQLDTVFKEETEEFKRILLLRHWIKSVIKIDDFGDPYPGDGYAEGILDAALEGQGFHCGHFMTVQNAIMNAYGHVTRTLGAGPSFEGGPDGHHGINEIWLNSYNKWFLSDAKYDHHFEKDGIPLSALEVRDEYLKNKGKGLTVVDGPDRIPFEVDEETGVTKERYAMTYTWVEWHAYNDMFTNWGDYKTLMLMYEDEYFQTHTWIWDGKPHWAYGTEYLVLEKNRDAIEWTPNVLSSTVTIEGNLANIILVSSTPNLKEYQMMESNEEKWQPVKDQVEISLKSEKHEIIFRAVNLADVPGPEHKVLIVGE
jgi:hypothetical protein